MSIAALVRSMLAVGAGNDAIILAVEAVEADGSVTEILSEVLTALGDCGYSPAVIGVTAAEVAKRLLSRKPATNGNDAARTRRYRERRAISETDWASIRIEVLDRDNRTCAYCGALNAVFCDHVVPVSRGGTNDPENLAASCGRCNSSKRDLLLDEWTGPPVGGWPNA